MMCQNKRSAAVFDAPTAPLTLTRAHRRRAGVAVHNSKWSRPCLGCGAMFVARLRMDGRTRVEYCSRSCWRRACHAPRVVRQCENCGDLFTPQLAHVKAGRGWYCSKPCSHEGHKTHGDTAGPNRAKHTAEYRAWRHMLVRCYNQKCKDYPDYGGRGIVVCDRWRTDYAAFLADMGRRPSPDLSIDRKDTNGNYELGNCRWATADEQVNNRRTPTIRVVLGSESHTITEWAQIAGMRRETLKARLYRMPPERAITQPVRIWRLKR